MSIELQVQYKVDCEEIYGRVLDNHNVLSIVEGTCTKQTEQIWNDMYPAEPYHLEQSSNSLISNLGSDTVPQRSTKYDLVAAVKRQSSFYKKVIKGKLFRGSVQLTISFIKFIDKKSYSLYFCSGITVDNG